MSAGRRAVALAGLLAAGLLLGLVGAFVQADRWILTVPWGVLVVPWGLVLVWITLVAVVRGGAWAVRTRWGAWAVLVGWLVATVALSAESPSGDLALSGGGRQMTYLLGGVILGSAAATLRVTPVTRARPEPLAGDERL